LQLIAAEGIRPRDYEFVEIFSRADNSLHDKRLLMSRPTVGAVLHGELFARACV
jgi:hypothetical protein